MFIYTLFTHPLTFVGYVVTISISITLHELAHGYAALSQGDDTPQRRGHLTLNPLVHMGWESLAMLCMTGIAWGQMPVNPGRFRDGRLSGAIVAVAGPLCNLGLGLLFVVVLKLNGESMLTIGTDSNLLYLAAYVNLTLFIFNLLPFPPLDGFYVVSEIFPALQILRDNPLSLIPLVALLINPDFGEVLHDFASWLIQA